MRKTFPIIVCALFLFGNISCNKNTALPEVVTGESSVLMESHTVVCEGTVINEGGSNVTDRGICYILKGEGSPSISSNHRSAGSGTGSFQCAISNLSLGEYDYCSYAINESGTSYGELKSFALLTMPTVTTGIASPDFATNSAICTGQVTSIGTVSLIETGICYVQGNGVPTIGDGCVKTEGANTTISVELQNLERGASYSYCAYAKNSYTTTYGDVKVFTFPNGAPTVKTLAGFIAEAPHDIYLQGRVLQHGESEIRMKGICYMEGTGTPTVYDNKIKDTTSSDAIKVLFVPEPGKTYSFRAFSSNYYGISYGEVKTFTMGSATVTFGGDTYTAYCPVGGYQFSINDHDGGDYWSMDLYQYSNHNRGYLFTIVTPRGITTGSYTGQLVNVTCHRAGSYYFFSATYSINGSGSEIYSNSHLVIIFYSQRYSNLADANWFAKSFTLNISSLNIGERRITYTLTALMVDVYTAFVPEGGNVGLDNAPTAQMTVHATNIPLQIGN